MQGTISHTTYVVKNCTKAQRKIWPNYLRVGGPAPPTPPTTGAELLSGTLPMGLRVVRGVAKALYN